MPHSRIHPHRWRALYLTGAAYLLLALHHSAQAQVAVIGILEGRATLLRPAGKLELAEGVVLNAADIVETAPAAFVQIEFADGVRLGLGESSRLMLAPAAAPGKTKPARSYLLQGWMKLTPGPDKPLGGDFLTPIGAIGALAGACVVHASPDQFAMFVETGSVALAERGGAARPLKAGNFLGSRGSDALVAAARPSPEFVQGMPRLFRDALPARAAKFRDRSVTPRVLGQVSYADAAAWLQADAAIRIPMIDTWRVRLGDAEFRAAVLTHLSRHPEWRPLVVPPKKPVPRPAAASAPPLAAPPALSATPASAPT